MRIAVDLQACQFNGRYRGIGRYSLNLVEHMLEVAGDHEFIVCLNDTADGDGIYPLVDRLARRMPRENIRVWSSMAGVGAVDESAAAAARRRHACLLRDTYLASLRPDVVHAASLFEGFGDDTAVRIASEEGLAPRTAVTLYDLIPLLRPAEYLQHPLVDRWYRERVADLRNAGMLLAISEASRREAIEHLGLPEDNIAMISSGVDPVFAPWRGTPSEIRAFRRRFGLCEQFVLYTGGFDSRKNLSRLVRAWAAARKLPDSQLVFAGMGEPNAIAELRAVAASEGLADDALRFLGYVSDEDLVRLYSITSLFAFPSIHEGFGLPILEAMACGAPVIAADATSLPEVVGLRDALFDPMSIASLTEKIEQVLDGPGFAERLRLHAVKQSRHFSWERSARQAVTALEELGSRQRQPVWRVSRVAHSEAASRERLDGLRQAAPGATVAASRQLAQGDIAVTVQCGDNDALSSTTLLLDASLRESGAVSIADMYATHGYAFARLHAQGRALHPGAPMAWRPPVDVDGFGFDPATAMRIPLNRQTGIPAEWRLLPEDSDSHFAANAIELAAGLGQSGHRALLRRLVERAGAIPAEQSLAADDLAPFAVAAARNHPDSASRRQLLLDVSELVHQDQATGIQRVVRRVLTALLDWRAPDIRVEPVFLAADGRYRYAAAFTSRFLGLDAPVRDDDLIDYVRGDVFLGLDLAQQCVVRSSDWFQRIRAAGVEVHFVIYDLLPWIRSEFFHPAARPNFEAWLHALSILADGVVCISRAVADEFISHLEALTLSARKSPLKIGYFHLGADLDADVTRRSTTPAELETAALIPKDVPVVLMVSTLEPRKGYQQTLDAFDLLWQDGDDVTLVIVGKLGWMFEHFAQRLRTHPQWMRQLFWFEAASDGMLQTLYREATVLLAASEGEGFGLPLIEAAQSGIPLLCRELPVFREVAGPHAAYFQARSGWELAQAMRDWLSSWRAGAGVPSSAGLRWQTWQASTRQLLDVVLKGDWYAEWRAGNRRILPAFSTRFATQVGILQGGCMGTTGEAGLLLHGPYIPLSAGHHRLSIRGRLRATNASTAWAEIVHTRGEIQVVRFALPGTSASGIILDLPFELDDDVQDLEVRIWVGEGDIASIASIGIIPFENARAPTLVHAQRARAVVGAGACVSSVTGFR
ncbi:glycosyltransferase family 4 protein [Luteimonas fraxinea]|uniref:glycosyltransferase family 4 protein n=1 Tax=Luteimonas fraxinea TaxID=2901869 RepID=UPI001E41085F|nr:glycosyltransferase family 1 protein [Luteimonas fraxinea]MCD9127330.1 glycosyltransferase family 4 protein [Luteimonas fraxinea]UHH09000.1 glycosyltransferase family 4 protein [Luteimonas fraxinea]